ncbi:MAG: beta-galactosidase [Verrucomicrobia bacterium]|nr:beta-galactosidase [Verrucomicrobiota bacterium]
MSSFSGKKVGQASCLSSSGFFDRRPACRWLGAWAGGTPVLRERQARCLSYFARRAARRFVVKLHYFIILFFAISGLYSSAATLKPLPPDFVQRVEQGWLPELCVRTDNPAIPPPLLRNWARPRDGKRVRVLFICSSQQQYEPLSLMHAFDLEGDLIPLWSAYSWKENDADPDTMNLLRYYLGTRHYDVIAMAGAWLSVLPDDCEKKIAEMVQEQGVGLVYALPGIFPRVPEMQGKPSPILDPLLPIALDASGYKETSRQVLSAGPHPLSQGAEFSRIQWFCNTDGKIVPEAQVLLRSEQPACLGAGRPEHMLAAAVTRGKGRVAAYNRCYNENTYGYAFLPVVECPGDETQTGKRCRWLGEGESANQFYNWLGRTLLWAAQAEPPLSIQSVSVAPVEQTVTLRITNATGKSLPVRLQGTARSPFGAVEKKFERKWQIHAGETQTRTFPLPHTGFQGLHMLELSLVSSQGKVSDWNSTAYQRNSTFKVALEPDFALHQPDENIKVRLQVSGLPSGKTFSVHTELFDLDGRLLADQSRQEKAAGGQIPVVESIKLSPPLITTTLANLRVTVTAGDEAVEVRDQLFVRQEPQWDQFHIMAYHGCDHNLVCADVLIEALKRSGHDTLLAGWPNPFRTRIDAETGLRLVANNVSLQCGYDSQKLKDQAGWLRKFSPVLYEQQDEPELQFTPCAETRFADPVNMERFRKWLKEKYGTLEVLNQAWGANYARWEDAPRAMWYDVLDTNNWTPWFDSRRDLDRSFVDQFDRCSKAIREIEPDRFCPINPRAIETFSAVNLREFTRRLHAGSLYNHFVSQPPMGYLELGAQWVEIAQSCNGYTWPSQPNKDGLAHEAWDTLRHGVKHLAWFAPLCDDTPPQGRFSYFAGNYTLNEKGRAIAQINHQLLAGPGDVAVNTAPVNEGVFIYYPRTLFYAHTLAFMKKQRENDPSLKPAEMKGIGPWMEMLPNSFVIPMRALGFQFQFGDEEDLTVERLKQTRVVLLSYAVCMGLRELELLRAFVKAGGCVVAEAGTARRDANGRLYEKTPEAFREIFGVQRPSPNPSPTVGKDGVAVCGAKKLDGVPPQIGAAYQNGKAFFLDFALPANADGNVVAQQILELAGLRPAYALRNNIERDGMIASLFARRMGNLTWLYVLGEGRERDRRYTIELPQQSHVYELTTGKNFGARATIEGQISYGEARVFALSPSPMTALKAGLSRKNYSPGDIVEISYTLTSQGGEVGDRIIRLEFNGPKEMRKPALPRSFRLPKGQAKLKFFLPLNTPGGAVELVATDLASGITCRTPFKITSPGFWQTRRFFESHGPESASRRMER